MNLKKTKLNNFILVQWNCNSFYSKIEMVKQYLDKFKPHILSLNEIKLTTTEANKYLRINGYSSVFKCREKYGNYGGGVALLIREDVNYEEIQNPEWLDIEAVCIKIQFNKADAFIFSLYNPPTACLESKIWEFLSVCRNDYIICGDFNAKSPGLGCRGRNKNGEYLEEVLINTKSVLLNKPVPTYYREATNYSELLDLIIASPRIASKMSNFKVELNEFLVSDHLPVEVWFSASGFSNQETNQKQKWNFKKANWGLYRTKLESKITELLMLINQPHDIEIINNFLTSSMLEAAKESIPLVENALTRKALPKYILDMIKERHELRKKLNKTTSKEVKSSTNLLGKKIKNEIKEIRSKNWINFVERCGKNPSSSRPFWNKVNEFRGAKRFNNIPVLKTREATFNSNEEKADCFGRILENNFSNNQGGDNEFQKQIKETIIKLKEHDQNDCFFEPVSKSELVEHLKNLNDNTAPGHDGIHNLMLKNMPEVFIDLLAQTINYSMATSTLPKEWKIATISMIPKKEGYSSDPNKYRPISLTSCIGKLTERIIKKRLISFLETNGLITKQQSGFRKNRSTQDNILFITQKISECLARKKKCLSIFFDITKAFDKVWHEALIYKMIQMKIPKYLVAWVQSFLEDRKFKVKINQTTGSTYPINAGVPQGAVISPILFIIYINDIPLLNRKNKAYSLLFADDLASIFCFNNKKEMLSTTKKYLVDLETWLNKWKLSMSANKCNYSIFSNGKKKYRFDFKLANQAIPYEERPKFLGVIFDARLTFKPQIDEIKNKCLKRLNIIKIISQRQWKLNEKALTTTYFALIRSIIDYSFICCSVLAETNIMLLQRVQNQAIKSIYKPDLRTNLRQLALAKGIVEVKTRQTELFNNFLFRCIFTNNELVNDLVKEYWQGFEAREEIDQTALSLVRSLVESLFEQSP
jgi:exonuclease III